MRPTSGVGYSYGPFDFRINGNYQGKYRISALSNTPTTANNGILYHTSRELWNISASYKHSKNVEAATRGPQHLQRARHHLLQHREPRQQYTIYGSMWNFGVKVSF